MSWTTGLAHNISILSFIYAAQNWAGNLISNQSIFFFEREYI